MLTSIITELQYLSFVVLRWNINHIINRSFTSWFTIFNNSLLDNIDSEVPITFNMSTLSIEKPQGNQKLFYQLMTK